MSKKGTIPAIDSVLHVIMQLVMKELIRNVNLNIIFSWLKCV